MYNGLLTWLGLDLREDVAHFGGNLQATFGIFLLLLRAIVECFGIFIGHGDPFLGTGDERAAAIGLRAGHDRCKLALRIEDVVLCFRKSNNRVFVMGVLYGIYRVIASRNFVDLESLMRQSFGHHRENRGGFCSARITIDIPHAKISGCGLRPHLRQVASPGVVRTDKVEPDAFAVARFCLDKIDERPQCCFAIRRYRF